MVIDMFTWLNDLRVCTRLRCVQPALVVAKHTLAKVMAGYILLPQPIVSMTTLSVAARAPRGS